MTSPVPVAFFDVDETLISVKSMFDFLRYQLEFRGAPKKTYERCTGDLRRAASNGAPREEVNRAYYRFSTGQNAAELAEAGRSWFGELAERDPFLAEPLARLNAHRDAGTIIVLISGSFFACLDPIAEAVGATWAIGTRPIVRGGRLTGEVITPMIGERKARAVSAVAGVRGVRLRDCAAYGDHASDLPLLRCVGHPTIVGDDPVLAAYARSHGWPRLSAARNAGHHTPLTTLDKNED